MLLFALIVEFFSSYAFITSQLLCRFPLHPETSCEATWGYGGQYGSNLPMIINEMLLIGVESVYFGF